MKNRFINYCMNTLQKNNNYSDTRLEELKYGLEAFYMLVTKLLVIFILSAVLGIFKELLLFMLFFSPLRALGFGFHANNSTECWVISIVIFILLPILAKTLTVPLTIIQIIIVFSILSFLFFAPADTKKRPLINRKKRLLLKSFLLTIGVAYLIVTFFITNQLVLNTLMFTALWQAICVNPIFYKLFGQSFDNYKTYLNEV